MKKELDDKLCADFPEIFRDRHGNMRETCMCWGFECGDGWYSLIDLLCAFLTSKVRQLQHDIEHISNMMRSENKGHWSEWMVKHYSQETLDKKKAELEEEIEKIPVAVQVKEKFGTLQFYVGGATDEQYNYIRFAESMSGRICETCGTTEDVFQTSGWIKTTCKTCSPDEYKEHMGAD